MSRKIGWGSDNVYEFLKDRVVWHDLRRNKNDLPEISPFLIILIEGYDYGNFGGLGRFCEGFHLSCGTYTYFETEEGGHRANVTRWAYVPEEVLTLYRKGFFNTCDNLRPNFKSKEEFDFYAKQAVSEKIPNDAEFIGHFEEDRPYEFYSASIYWHDGKYYISDSQKNWTLD